MTGPIHLGAGWILALITVGLIIIAVAVRLFVKKVVPFEAGMREEAWPKRNEGGGYDWPDGRITRDREGKEEIRR